MEHSQLPSPLATITLLADDTRWSVLKVLAESDMPVALLADTLQLPRTQIDAALAPLRDARLIIERRSDAGNGEVFLRTDLQRLRDRFLEAGADLHPYVVDDTIDLEPEPQQRPRILFLCTRNSARSQIGEVLTRTLSKGAVDAFSAGAQPGEVHPMTKQVLANFTDVEQLRSKPVSEFTDQHFDYVITVCDKAREACPTFPGGTKLLHWSTQDPVADSGNAEANEWAFNATFNELSNRIRYLLILMEREQHFAVQ